MHIACILQAYCRHIAGIVPRCRPAELYVFVGEMLPKLPLPPCSKSVIIFRLFGRGLRHLMTLETRIEWYANGTKASEAMYRDGIRHGEARDWFEDGAPMFEGMYYDGRRHGTFFEFYEDGQIRSQGNFIDDQQHGHWRVWWPEGQLADESLLENNQNLLKKHFWNGGTQDTDLVFLKKDNRMVEYPLRKVMSFSEESLAIRISP